MELLEHFDRKDSFMTRNTADIARRRGIGGIKRRGMPEWFRNDRKVKEFLLRRFPKWRTDSSQHFKAKKWATIIHDYFLRGMSDAQIKEGHPNLLFTSRHQVSREVQLIKFAAKGLRLDGRKPTGRKRGRPAKRRSTTFPRPLTGRRN